MCVQPGLHGFGIVRRQVVHEAVDRLPYWCRRQHQVQKCQDVYKTRPDPDFETSAADVIGIYLEPPRHAVVFFVDEKTFSQGLDWTALLPLSPRPRRTV